MDKLLSGFLWSVIIFFALSSCNSDSSIHDKIVTSPVIAGNPENVRFDYILFQNDFDVIPADADPDEYPDDKNYSGNSKMSFRLSNKRKYSPGLNGIIKKNKKNEWYRISFYCFKPSESVSSSENVKGEAVLSFQRGDSIINYQNFSIVDYLKKYNLHIVDNWEKLTFWYKVPDNIHSDDRLKIYIYNPYGGDILIDDFTLEVWTENPLKPVGVELSENVFFQDYESPDLSSQTTKEIAFSGSFSSVISAGSEHSQYGAGFESTLADADIIPGDYLRITFAALKKHKVKYYYKSAKLVISLERNQQQLLWEGFPVDPRIVNDGVQASGQWCDLEIWKQVPEDVQPTDLLKVYTWNTQTVPVYFDDLKIEVWRKVMTEE
jgi:hypothetical protein